VRVLVVEDHRDMAELLDQGLREAGFAVDVLATGEDAVSMATEYDYDAIVLDVMLPGIDGIEACRRIRNAGRLAPVLLLTARDAIRDRVSGLDAGADDYLTKPFSFDELLARLRALTRRGPAERQPLLEIDGLTLDPAAHRVARDGREIELTPKEFALLEFFMCHPGEVLSRTKLLEHVWDFAFDGDSNVVDVFVRLLREKIDRPFAVDSIETVRGVGYRLLERAER
jgi:two-component system OmpR family response regulator